MYHEPSIYHRGYYDTIDELPAKCNVRFPDSDDWVEMSPDEVCNLDGKYYTIMHSSNFGICDHWTSEKPSKWVRERFEKIIQYTAKGKIVGYNRDSTNITLTLESNYWKSEVWNS